MVVVLVTRPSPTSGVRTGQLTNGAVVHCGGSGNPDATVWDGGIMGLTALVFSAVEETGPFGYAAIHKGVVAEFYRCWCFSATSGRVWEVLTARISGRSHTMCFPDRARIGPI